MPRPTASPLPPAPSGPSPGPGEPLGARLRDRLQRQTGRPVALIETHISWVLLTGEFAYKIKKPVDLGFLDFTTLESRAALLRARNCDSTAGSRPTSISTSSPSRGSAAAPALAGDGPVLDYAVRMREFPQDALLPQVLAHGALTAAQVDALAAEVAAFHRRIDAAPADGPYGVPADILRTRCRTSTPHPPAGRLPRRRAGARPRSSRGPRATMRRCGRRLDERRRGGFVRECHGDLHLGNIALRRRPARRSSTASSSTPELRWIDVMSEVAFLGDGSGRPRPPRLAPPLRSTATSRRPATTPAPRCCASTSSIAPWCAPRSRACARASWLPAATRAACSTKCRGYVDLARALRGPATGAIVITHGLPAAARRRWRRRWSRRWARSASARTSSASACTGLPPTTAAARRSARTCTRRRHRAHLRARRRRDGPGRGRRPRRHRRRGVPPAPHRDRFRALAAALGVPFVIVDCTAAESTLRARIDARARRGNDPSEADAAVLDYQLRTQDALGADEMPFVLRHDTESSSAAGPDPAWSSALAARLDGAGSPTPAPSHPGDDATYRIERQP